MKSWSTTGISAGRAERSTLRDLLELIVLQHAVADLLHAAFRIQCDERGHAAQLSERALALQDALLTVVIQAEGHRHCVLEERQKRGCIRLQEHACDLNGRVLTQELGQIRERELRRLVVGGEQKEQQRLARVRAQLDRPTISLRERELYRGS